MKGFMLDEHGDVVIQNGKIQMIDGSDLLLQKANSVLGTNKGEWPLNPDEGIVFQNILGKNKTDEMIKYEIQQGLIQVDDTFMITGFEREEFENRKHVVKTTAQNATGSELKTTTTYGN